MSIRELEELTRKREERIVDVACSLLQFVSIDDKNHFIVSPAHLETVKPQLQEIAKLKSLINETKLAIQISRENYVKIFGSETTDPVSEVEHKLFIFRQDKRSYENQIEQLKVGQDDRLIYLKKKIAELDKKITEHEKYLEKVSFPLGSLDTTPTPGLRTYGLAKRK